VCVSGAESTRERRQGTRQDADAHPPAPARPPELSQAQLRAILEWVTEGVITTDESQTILMANQAAATMFGRDDLPGLALEELIPAHFRERHAQDVRVFGEGAVGPRQMGHRSGVSGLRADGGEFPIDATISLAIVDGRPLYTVVLRDLTEERDAERELAASHAALQRLVAAQDRVAEEERKRIARELHDDLAQTLAMLSITLGMAGRTIDREPARAAEFIADAIRLASDTVTAARRLINDLRPQALEELGLVEALRALAAEFTRRTGVVCDVDFDGRPEDVSGLDPDVAACLYRVAQESLNNVAKHAQARRVHLSLACSDDGRLVLDVVDDGVGLAPGYRHKSESFGLQGMNERVRAVGGEITIISRDSSGTTVSASVPGRAAAAAA
jgi:PAS domain S-box-containing protein